MMKALVTNILILIVSLQYGMGQTKYIFLHKQGSPSGYKIRIGDKFGYKYHDQDDYYYGQIVDLRDSTIVLNSGEIGVNEIASVRVAHLSKSYLNLNTIGSFLQIGGIGYLVIDQFNQAVVNGDGLGVGKSVGTSTAIFVAVGSAIRLLKMKNFRITGMNRIKIIELNADDFTAQPEG